MPFFATPVDYSPPGSSVHGILQSGVLEQVAISSFPSLADLPDPGTGPVSLCLLPWQVDSLPVVPPGKLYMHAGGI